MGFDAKLQSCITPGGNRKKELDGLDDLLKEKERKLTADQKLNDERDSKLYRAEEVIQQREKDVLTQTVAANVLSEKSHALIEQYTRATSELAESKKLLESEIARNHEWDKELGNFIKI